MKKRGQTTEAIKARTRRARQPIGFLMTDEGAVPLTWDRRWSFFRAAEPGAQLALNRIPPRDAFAGLDELLDDSLKRLALDNQ